MSTVVEGVGDATCESLDRARFAAVSWWMTSIILPLRFTFRGLVHSPTLRRPVFQNELGSPHLWICQGVALILIEAR